MLKVQEIREIVEMIENSSIQRFEFSQADTKLVIVKQEKDAPTVLSVPTVEESGEEIPVRSASAPAPESKRKIQDDLYTVTSPMVGTFYAASDPESEAFVKPGQEVSDDTVVCIIEVMKLFNEVHAGVTGQIAEVLVKDGDFVEYGQPLFLVKKA